MQGSPQGGLCPPHPPPTACLGTGGEAGDEGLPSTDIMHVGAVLGARAEARDVELAQLAFLRQLDVVAEIAVIPLEERWRSRGQGSRGPWGFTQRGHHLATGAAA